MRMQPKLSAAAKRVSKRVQIGPATPQYGERLSESVFCFCPRGHGVWSPRMVDAIMHGCIPVILGDSYWLPLSCLLDWREFSLFLPETEPGRWPELLLAALPRAPQMHEAALRVRRHFVWRNTTEDHFNMMLLEIFLRRQACA